MDVNDSNYLEEDIPINCVQLDALVTLKIVKHCRENLPELVTGQLLGLDMDGLLEVTNSFPFPQRGADEEEGEEEGAEYQMEMMRCLREVNVDNNTVGWYQSTYLGSFVNESMIETQYNYQTTIKHCVVVVYDPLRSVQGALSLTAYRLTDEFMNLYAAGDFSAESLHKTAASFTEILQEVPIKIHNSPLVNCMLFELSSPATIGAFSTHTFNKLDLHMNPFMEKTMEFFIDNVDELSAEQGKLQYYNRCVQRQQATLGQWLQKRRQENAIRRSAGEVELPEEEDPAYIQLSKTIAPPSRLDSLLANAQINTYCKELTDFAGQSFSKLFLLSGVENDLNSL